VICVVATWTRFPFWSDGGKFTRSLGLLYIASPVRGWPAPGDPE
jgi:hypothetical protein